MPRHRKIRTGSDLESIRGLWWSWAYELRQLVGHLPLEKRTALEHLSDLIPPCPITVYGGPPANWPPPEAYRLAKVYNIQDVEWLNPWFITEDGWTAYKTAWDNLPEVVSLYTAPCVQNGGVVPVVHRVDEIEPEKRRV